MARIIHESIAGVNLFVPAANDFFDIDPTGMPNGDPCLVINPSGLSSPDVRAFAPAPTLSPNIFKAAGEGPFSLTFWVKSPGVAGAGNLNIGVQGATADISIATNHPLRIDLSLANSNNVGVCTLSVHNGSSGANGYSAGATTAPNIWKFYAFMYDTPGNPGATYAAVQGSTPPLTLTSQANRLAGTTSFGADLYFYIGRYSDSMSAPSVGTRVLRIGKIAFHDKFLTLTELQMMFDTMT